MTQLEGPRNRSFVSLDHPAYRQGVIFGIALGVAHLVNGLINNLMNLDVTGNDLLGNSFLLAMIITFSLAGWRAAQVTGRVRAGTLAGVVAAVVGSVLGAISLFIITFTFMETIRHNTFMIQDWQRSGMNDMDVFIVEDALGAIFFGSLLSLALGVVLGTLGGWFGRARTTMRPI